MSENKENIDAAQAAPTKRFFVNMLTRDISLEDAILDLLDNCLDGALRSSENGSVDYSKFDVSIKFDENSFSIKDNCGGIPRDIAINYAFKMGREISDQRDGDSETIGMYGIGMKRAMFKMGKNSLVRSFHNGDCFEVGIDPAWLELEAWNPLPILSLPANTNEGESGTEILVDQLLPGVSRLFANEGFQDDLHSAIAEHFTIFLQAGLTVSLNGTKIEPVGVEVLVTEGEDTPAPYVFKKTIDGVDVSIVVGLNTATGVGDDDDDPTGFDQDRSSATAGWTVLCNDRAVIVGDKSRLTGWGDGLPLYHYQFSIITGIVEFKSKDADNLPVTTTKRALDTTSTAWLEALVKMKEGMRMWVTYTNHWKNHSSSERSASWEKSKSMPIQNAVEAVLKREGTVKRQGATEYNPSKRNVIPKPADRKPSARRVIYSKPAEEIRKLAIELYDDEKAKPAEVGKRCFEMILNSLEEK